MTVKIAAQFDTKTHYLYTIEIPKNMPIGDRDPHKLTIADIAELSKLKRPNGYYIVDSDHIGRMVAEWCDDHWEIVGSEHNYNDDRFPVISGPIPLTEWIEWDGTGTPPTGRVTVKLRSGITMTDDAKDFGWNLSSYSPVAGDIIAYRKES